MTNHIVAYSPGDVLIEFSEDVVSSVVPAKFVLYEKLRQYTPTMSVVGNGVFAIGTEYRNVENGNVFDRAFENNNKFNIKVFNRINEVRPGVGLNPIESFNSVKIFKTSGIIPPVGNIYTKLYFFSNAESPSIVYVPNEMVYDNDKVIYVNCSLDTRSNDLVIQDAVKREIERILRKSASQT